MHEAVPFRTDDAILAQCLVNAGVPEWQTPTTSYDESILRGLGYEGTPLLEAARLACKKKQRGHVDYYFERAPELDHFVKAYRDQEAKINSKDEDTDAGAALREIMAAAAATESPMDEREALLRITCINLKCRVAFVNRWKDYPPFLRLNDKGDEQPIGGGVVKFPGFKLVPINSTPEQLAKLGL